jgi:hypothetical protein
MRDIMRSRYNPGRSASIATIPACGESVNIALSTPAGLQKYE